MLCTSTELVGHLGGNGPFVRRAAAMGEAGHQRQRGGQHGFLFGQQVFLILVGAGGLGVRMRVGVVRHAGSVVLRQKSLRQCGEHWPRRLWF
jgi:hypothetical protein